MNVFGRRILAMTASLFTAVIGLAVASPTALAQTVVGFDDLAPGTQVTTQYQANGITFDSIPVGPAGLIPVVTAVPAGEPQSPPQVADMSVCPGCEFFTPFVTATFSDAHRKVSVRVGKFDDASLIADTVTLTGYDSSGAAVAEATTTIGAPSGFHALLAIQTPKPVIAAIRIEGGLIDDHLGIDNVRLGRQIAKSPDFAIDPSEASLTVLQGRSASTAISIARLGGSTGAIQFAATGAPAGVTVAFSPNPTGGAGTTMTVSAAASAPIVQVGQPLTITATPLSSSAGPQARTATVNIIIAPDFTLSLDQSQVTAWSCSSAPAVHVQVVRTPGFTGDITLSAQGVPAGVTASFNPTVLSNPTDGGFVNSSTLNLNVPQSGPEGNFPVTITAAAGGVPTATATLLLVRRAGAITTFSPSSGLEPQDLRAGSQVILNGHGLCPGSTVEFGPSTNAVAPATFVSADRSELVTHVPRFAVTGPLTVSTPFGDQFASPASFAPTSYRANDGFAFVNPSIGGYSFGDVKDGYGGDQVDLTLNPCVFFDCSFDTGIPSPEGLIFWGILDASLTDGQCFGVSLSTQRLVNGDASFSSFPPPGATVPWQLSGPAAASPPLLHYVHVQHAFQFSAEFLHYALGEMTANLLAGNSAARISSQVAAALQIHNHPLVIMENGGSGHVVVAYDLQADPSEAGAYFIDIYDPNHPFVSSEFTDGPTHFSNEQEGRIHVSANGDWSFPDLGYTGGPGSLYVAPYHVVPIHPTNPVSITGILTIISPLGTGASVAQVTNGQARHLYDSEGNLNTNPQTRLTTARPFAPIEATSQQQHPPIVIAEPGRHYAATFASDGSANTYGALGTMPGMTISVTGVPQSPGQDDMLTLEPRLQSARFSTQAAQKAIVMTMTHAGPRGTRRSLAVTTTTRRNGSDVVGIRRHDGAPVYIHTGAPSTATFRLTAGGGSDLPGVFQSTPMTVADGEKLTLTPSSWHDLAGARLRVTVVHRNGAVTVLHLKNAIHFTGHVSITSLSAKRARGRGHKLGVSTAYTGIPEGATAIVTWQVLSPDHRQIAHHTRVVSAPTAGDKTYTWVWHNRHAKGTFTFVASVIVVERQPIATQQVVRRLRFHDVRPND